MNNDLALRQPFRSFLCQTACCVESKFTVAETLDGVYSTLDFWIEVSRKDAKEQRQDAEKSFACFVPLREKNFVDRL